MKRNQSRHEVAENRHDELRGLLERRRAELLDQLHSAMRNVSVTQVVERQDLRDQVDQSAVEMRHDLDLALLEMRSETLARIDDALAQLAEGRYGSCNQCGRDIAVARLAAMPFATRCRVCEQAREEKRVRELAGKRRDERIYGRAEGAVFRP